MDAMTSLETHRFRIEPVDRELLNRVKGALGQVREQYPQIKGVAFYGSRTKGRAKPNSDLDMFIFYDGSELANPYAQSDPLNIDPEKYKKFNEYDSTVGKKAVLFNARKSFYLAVSDSTGHAEVELSPFDVDISKEATDELLEHYIDHPEYGGDPGRVMAARFLLGVGDDLYKNRKYILDQLENNPRGEEVFKIIMANLSNFERRDEEGAYKRYPTSIEQAREFFQTR